MKKPANPTSNRPAPDRPYDWEDDADYRLGLLPDSAFGEFTPEELAKLKPAVERANAENARRFAERFAK